MSFYSLINGKQLVKAGSFIDLINPATGTLIAQIQDSDAAVADHAVRNARQTFESGVWSKAPVQHRSQVLLNISRLFKERLDSFVEKEVLQTGRPVKEMRSQLSRLPEWLDYFAAVCRTFEGSSPPFQGQMLNVMKRVPLGVACQISSFNHPLLIAIKKLAPALAAGNSIVLKPSEQAPMTVVEFGQLCIEAGLPPGCLNIVLGDRKTSQYLSKHSLIDKVDITGGTEAGRAVLTSAASNLKAGVAELGGKTPMIIFKDCDINEAVNGALFGCFIASSQTCVSSGRILVDKSIKDEFESLVAERISQLRMGDPFNFHTQIGPVISAKSLARIEQMVSRAIEEGATLKVGGKRVQGPGFYHEPTLLTNVTSEMEIFQEEVFGPVMSISTFDSEQDAIKLANNSKYGLACSIWTRDVKRSIRVSEEIEAGIIWINTHHANDPSSCWGGFKLSGIGRENGLEAYREYSTVKSIVFNYGNAPDWFGEATNPRYG